MIRTVIRLALVAGLPLTCLAEQKVTAVSVDPVSVYELQKDGLFVRSGKLALNELPLPIPVLEQSPRGYLKVPHNGREVWLDSMDAEVFPPLESATADACRFGMDQWLLYPEVPGRDAHEAPQLCSAMVCRARRLCSD